jgi:hypothetical protein
MRLTPGNRWNSGIRSLEIMADNTNVFSQVNTLDYTKLNTFDYTSLNTFEYIQVSVEQFWPVKRRRFKW